MRTRRTTPLSARNILACCILTWVCSINSFCQSPDQHSFALLLRSGLIQQTTTDQLLNYYNYSGKGVPVVLDGFYFSKRHLFVISVLYQSATLYPDNLQDNYYEFNYVHHREGEVKLEYFHEITKKDQTVAAFVGISNSSSIVTQQESYKNLFSPNPEGYREAYALSPVSLSPALMINVRSKNQSVMVKGTYAILNYTARPDDNFVKQLDLPHTHQWNWYGPAEYQSIYLSGMYQYKISEKIGITAEYNMLYRTYTLTDDYQYLRHSFLLGLIKTF